MTLPLFLGCFELNRELNPRNCRNNPATATCACFAPTVYTSHLPCSLSPMRWIPGGAKSKRQLTGGTKSYLSNCIE